MLQLVIDMGFHKLAHSVMDLKTVQKKTEVWRKKQQQQNTRISGGNILVHQQLGFWIDSKIQRLCMSL